MTPDQQDGIGMDSLDMQLLALGEAALPVGFDGRLKSFREMMSAVDGLPVSEDNELDDDADREHVPDELARDAFELGLAFLNQGDLDRAEHWLGRAVRYGLGQAEQKLADLAELRIAFTEIDLDFLPASWSLSSLGRAQTEQGSRADTSLTEAQESARAIIDDAHRRAASIIALAEVQAQQRATSRPHPTDDNMRSVRLWWQAYGDPRTDITLLSPTDTSQSNAHRVPGAAAPGVCKTNLWTRLLRDAVASDQHIVLFVSHWGPAAVSDGALRWSGSCREHAATAAHSWYSAPAAGSQDDLLQLYEFVGGDVDRLRRSPWWYLWKQAGADGGRWPSRDPNLTHARKLLIQHLDAYSPSKAAFDLLTADTGGAMTATAWLEQSDGLILPSDLTAELATATAGKGRP